MDEARAVLDGRLDRAAIPGLFDRLEWFASLHDHVFPDLPVRVVQIVDEGCELWMFLLESAPRRLSALANWYSFAWTPIFLGDPAPELQARLLTQLARHVRGQAQLDLYPVTAARTALVAAFRRAGWLAVQRPMGGRYLLHLNGRDFASYWAERPGRLRNQVRRKGRGAPFSLSIANRLTDDLWRDYVDVTARSWKAPEPNTAFLRALAERESAAGTLRLGFARQEGRAVATQLWTVENGIALIHKLAHDSTCDAASPGTLLSHHMFASAIDTDGATLIDYGTGDNDYKVEWMDERETLYRIDCFNPRFASTWLPAARAAISALVG